MTIECRQNAWLLHYENGVQLWISHPKWWLIGIIPAIVSVPVSS